MTWYNCTHHTAAALDKIANVELHLRFAVQLMLCNIGVVRCCNVVVCKWLRHVLVHSAGVGGVDEIEHGPLDQSLEAIVVEFQVC